MKTHVWSHMDFNDKNNCVSIGKVRNIYIFQVYGEVSLKRVLKYSEDIINKRIIEDLLEMR